MRKWALGVSCWRGPRIQVRARGSHIEQLEVFDGRCGRHCLRLNTFAACIGLMLPSTGSESCRIPLTFGPGIVMTGQQNSCAPYQVLRNQSATTDFLLKLQDGLSFGSVTLFLDCNSICRVLWIALHLQSCKVLCAAKFTMVDVVCNQGLLPLSKGLCPAGHVLALPSVPSHMITGYCFGGSSLHVAG